MAGADLSTRESDGQVIVALRGQLDMAEAASVAVLRVLTLTRLINAFPLHVTVDEAAGHSRRVAAVPVPPAVPASRLSPLPASSDPIR